MKELNGLELSSFIKQRQARQVRALRQSWRVVPRLAIIQTKDDPTIDMYVRLKKQYAEDILIDVDVHRVAQEDVSSLITSLNNDELIHGIVLQLPLDDPSETEALVDTISPSKDVDGLGQDADYDAATPTAINWLLAGYGVELSGKDLVVIGGGRLVGAPLVKVWQDSGLNVRLVDEHVENSNEIIQKADVIVTATGVPGLVTSDMIKSGAVVVDAGTASDKGRVVGDVADDVRNRSDLTITPVKGGVGPLTIAALLDNVVRAARAAADISGQKDLG